MTRKQWAKVLEKRKRHTARMHALALATRRRQRERKRQELRDKRATESLRLEEAARCKRYYRSVAFASAKQYAKELILWVTRQENGRDVGMSYDIILDLVREKFPIITYNGPHTGKPIEMTVKQLREIAYSMQSIDRALRFPVRPRSKRGRERPMQNTRSLKKAEHATSGTTALRKG